MLFDEFPLHILLGFFLEKSSRSFFFLLCLFDNSTVQSMTCKLHIGTACSASLQSSSSSHCHRHLNTSGSLAHFQVGLRTLAIGHRKFTSEEYQHVNALLTEAKTSIQDREKRVNAAVFFSLSLSLSLLCFFVG